MLPISDEDVRGASTPLVSWGFIVLNVIVFLYELSLGSGQLEPFIRKYGVVPAQIAEGRNLISLLTSMFLHGGWTHVISNIVFLGVFGDNIEAVLGKIWYPLFYIAGGLAGSLAHLLFNMGSTVPSLGASGAIAALLGAYVVMFPRSKIKALVFLGFYIFTTRTTAIVFLGIWFISQLFNGVASLGVETAQTAGVAYWAHIGGFVFGVVVGFLARQRAKKLTVR